jgi:hypothetical protein
LQISEWTKEFGRAYGFQKVCFDENSTIKLFKGWRNFLVISDPQLVQEMVHKFEYFNEREVVLIVASAILML